MSYSNSAVPRPDEAGSGGRGIYCCVPMCCGSSQYGNHKTKTNIALFSFPATKFTNTDAKGAKTTFKLLSIRKFVNFISSQRGSKLTWEGA